MVYLLTINISIKDNKQLSIQEILIRSSYSGQILEKKLKKDCFWNHPRVPHIILLDQLNFYLKSISDDGAPAKNHIGQFII